MNRFTRILALPLLSAGILGAALGLAGTASAGIVVNDDGSMVATPDTYAQQTMMYPRWGYYWPSYAGGPNTDTTVYQSR
ncbi:hypothetical protein [Mycolicibacterium sp.]|uniref:hypothetical protein n=1 Tax=Mycolicibacterium sp. TaxID=2320850 RepID=UPI003D0F8432